MSDPKIIIETEDSERPVVEIKNLPSKSDEVIPVGKKFNFRDENSISDDGSVVSLKSVKEKEKPKTNFDFGIYADPRKTKKSAKYDSGDEEDSEGDEEEYTEDSEGDDDDDESENSDHSNAESEPQFGTTKTTNVLSGAKLRIKKKELLLKLHDAEQNGYQVSGKYNLKSDLEDLEAEYELYEKRMEQNAMVDFLQDGLMLIIKGIEMFNGMYKPMGVNLNGLSDKIYDRRDQLEHVLKRLAIKYSGGTEMPPELSLLFIIGGAMVMTHISNTALSSGGIDKLLSGALGALGGGGQGENPLMNMMSGLMKNNSNSNKPAPTAQPELRPPPSFDINSLLSKMNDVGSSKSKEELPFGKLNLPEPNPFPRMTRDGDVGKPATTARMPDNSDRFSVSSDISDTSTMNITVPSATRRGKKGTKGKSKNVFQI